MQEIHCDPNDNDYSITLYIDTSHSGVSNVQETIHVMYYTFISIYGMRPL